MSRGITDDAEFDEDVDTSEDISLNEVAEMVFIVFNEIKVMQEKLDQLLQSKEQDG